MLVTMKNKVTLGIKKSLDRAKQIEGIPNCIELDQYEARSLLFEICNVKSKSISVFQVNQLITHIDFLLRKEKIEQTMKEILVGWHKGDYGITFDDVPIVIKVVKSDDTFDITNIKPGLTD